MSKGCARSKNRRKAKRGEFDVKSQIRPNLKNGHNGSVLFFKNFSPCEGRKKIYLKNFKGAKEVLKTILRPSMKDWGRFRELSWADGLRL